MQLGGAWYCPDAERIFMREEKEQIIERQRVLLAGVDTGEEQDFERSMKELGSLAEACNMQVAGVITQKLDNVNKALCIGAGKVKEVQELAENMGADVIVFDNALSPTQIRNLGNALEKTVMDRTNLILDIFATRAQTREAKLQVETARLQYMLPRLVGMREALSRQGGASGSMSSKGSGEKKLELDRRKIEHRIAQLRRELEEVSRERDTQRKRRSNSRTPQVALVGYTNAGKSTVLNQMVERYGEGPEKRVLEKDMLFATLETSVRNIDAGDNRPFFLVDTVGFIHKLPHGLVKAFQSTLEEVKYADLLVQVIDYSDENYKQHMEVTQQTLKELGAGDIPMLYVFNKADCCGMERLPRVKGQQIYMSAVNGVGMEELSCLIKELVYADNIDCRFRIPYEKGNIASYLCQNASVLSREYLDEGIFLHVNCHRQDASKYQQYRVG